MNASSWSQVTESVGNSGGPLWLLGARHLTSRVEYRSKPCGEHAAPRRRKARLAPPARGVTRCRMLLIHRERKASPDVSAWLSTAK